MALAETLADDLAVRRPGRLPERRDRRPAAGPARPVGGRLVDPLRARGRAALAVATSGFLRPASVRLERGRTNPDSFYENWFDLPALSREVLGPLTGAPAGCCPTSGTRRPTGPPAAPYVDLPPRGVLLLHGPLLLGSRTGRRLQPSTCS